MAVLIGAPVYVLAVIQFIDFLLRRNGSVLTCLPHVEGCRFVPQTGHTKDHH